MFIRQQDVKNLISLSKINDRRRSHILLHENSNDEIQQILFCIQPDTLMDVHRHSKGTETIICLDGSMAVTLFEAQEMSVFLLNKRNPIFKFDPKYYHTYTSLEEDTVAVEIKEGPYIKDNFISHSEWNDIPERVRLNQIIREKVVKQYE